MKLLFDLFPVILFFATFKFGQDHTQAFAQFIQKLIGGELDLAQAPILVATFVAIVASLIQVALVFAKGKKPELMLWISLVIIIVFGSLTILLHNELFIKWKPTILYWIFGLILIYGSLTHKNFLGKIFAKQIELSQETWLLMQKVWTGFFIFVGAINLLVAYNFSTDVWVNFKLFGLFSLTLIFTIAFGIWVSFLTEKENHSEKQ